MAQWALIPEAGRWPVWGDGRAASEAWALGLGAGRLWGECPAEAPGQPRGEPCKGASPEPPALTKAGVSNTAVLNCLRHTVQARTPNVYHQAWEG